MSSSGGAQLLQEVTLDDSSIKEQEKYDNLADMFAIIRTLQFLEVAFSRDMTTAVDYEHECDKLLRNYKSTKIQNGGDSFSLDDFVKTYDLDCPLAVSRLKIGINSVRETGIGVQSSGDSQTKIASDVCVHFQAVMDTTFVGGHAKEAIKPALQKVLDSLNLVTGLPASYQGKDVILKWLSKYEPMGALDVLDEGDAADFDLVINEQFTAFRGTL